MSPSSPTFPCVRCGRPVRRRPATSTRPRHIACPRCKYLLYDYPRAAAGVLVLKGDDVLLLRRAHTPRVGCLDVPGGFIEARENIEGAARRELREETGITVAALEPLGFYWDEYDLPGFGKFPTMNWYFVGRWRRGIPVGADDAASAEWVPLARLAAMKREYAWGHMPQLFGDLAKWAKTQRPASERALASKPSRPSSAAQRAR